MADIKLTMSTDERVRAPSIEDEQARLKELGALWYPLGSNRPLRAGKRCWVYLIRDGELVARARAEEIGPPPAELFTYTGQPSKSNSCSVRISEMELATTPIPHTGFRSFRYVTAEEKGKFEAVFGPRG